ncbi:MAG: macro domain-containing protein [Spirochaetales bacterium]|nr:macro domain-containing protein [Spirochaetales bacterium]
MKETLLVPEILKGDITRLDVDVIVNAAHNGLTGGGGVDGAIHHAAGPRLLAECRRVGFCATGDTVATGPANLPCRWVFHTVGPVWRGGGFQEQALLASCYLSCLELVNKKHAFSIAFPNVSTGVYGFPKPLACQIVTRTVQEFLKNPTSLRRLIFVCHDEENYRLYRAAWSGS